MHSQCAKWTNQNFYNLLLFFSGIFLFHSYVFFSILSPYQHLLLHHSALSRLSLFASLLSFMLMPMLEHYQERCCSLRDREPGAKSGTLLTRTCPSICPWQHPCVSVKLHMIKGLPLFTAFNFCLFSGLYLLSIPSHGSFRSEGLWALFITLLFHTHFHCLPCLSFSLYPLFPQNWGCCHSYCPVVGSPNPSYLLLPLSAQVCICFSDANQQRTSLSEVTHFQTPTSCESPTTWHIQHRHGTEYILLMRPFQRRAEWLYCSALLEQ